jgi:hypothetical protein
MIMQISFGVARRLAKDVVGAFSVALFQRFVNDKNLALPIKNIKLFCFPVELN